MSVAETVRPSVRGADAFRVAALLGAAAAAGGGLVGFVAGAAWAAGGGPPLGPGAAAALAGAAAAGDAAARRWPAARPIALGRQVPQLWGRIFGPGTAAVLYGARLGVGPLTILTSWTWWAAAVVGASLGPWPGAAVGVAFGVARTVTTLAVGRGAPTGDAMRGRMARLAAAEPLTAWAGVAAVGVVAVSAVAG